ncbi:hypothetical protein ABZ129_30925, partial [Streptomyces sp. NPDC006307]
MSAHQPTTTPAAAEVVRDAALWTAMLVRQFPELLTELAPSPGRGAAPRDRPAFAEGDRPERPAP